MAAARGESPVKKLGTTIEILREILMLIPDDLVGWRDRVLLLLGFAGALRRAELAALRMEHLEARERGLSLTLPHSKGERSERGQWRPPTAPRPYVWYPPCAAARSPPASPKARRLSPARRSLRRASPERRAVTGEDASILISGNRADF